VPNIDALIAREGGYTMDADDRGGETNFGITHSEARRFGYMGDMRDMPRTVAYDIYNNKYYRAPGFDKVEPEFPQLADKLFDFGVNCGPATATKALQRCLNGLNNGASDYPEVKVDGVLGPATLYSVVAFLRKRQGMGGRRTLLFMLAAQQSEYYLRIAENDPTQEKFLYGWESQRALYDAIP